MGLVHRGEADAGLGEGLGDLADGQRLGSGHHQQRPAGADAFQRLAARAGAHGTVEPHAVDPAFEQDAVLVAQQGQQGRDHHHGLVQHHRRDLVAGRFPEACGKDHQDAATGEHVGEHLLLLRVEAFDAEAPRRIGDLGGRRSRRPARVRHPWALPGITMVPSGRNPAVRSRPLLRPGPA
jgi:hypothetical protein